MSHSLARVVSGGQTGVDRAALDAALAIGFPCGGWCPAGRLAEDGPIPDRYPLRVMGGGYLTRNRQNVADSDGTLILTFGALKGGTGRTAEFCQRLEKPYLVLDANQVPVSEGVVQATAWIEVQRIAVLNVAGPRASGEPRGYDFAYAVVSGLLGARYGSQT